VNVNGKNLCTSCFCDKTGEADVCGFCGYYEGKPQNATSLSVGTMLLGRYAIGRVLGKGGFGVTYLAYDLKRESKVAIKEYMPDSLSYRTPGVTTVSTYEGEKEESFNLGAEKFYEEAKTVSKFNGHPNIINVYEFFYENNTAYFVMEYIEGVDLKTYIIQKGNKLSEEECVRLLTPIMDALIVVHSIGILHRDISPDNIYITKNGDVKLLDFGAARQVLGEKSKSLSVVLKPGFAPIEQYQTRGNQGQWTDVYALAATMYFCLTGQVPEAAMDRVYEDTIRNIFELNSNISEKLEKTLMKALEVRPESRYRTVYEFKQSIIGEQIPCINSFDNNQIKQEDEYLYVEKRTNRRIFPTIAACVLIICLTVLGVYKIKNTYQNHNDNENGKKDVVAAGLVTAATSKVTQNTSLKSTDENQVTPDAPNNITNVKETSQNSIKGPAQESIPKKTSTEVTKTIIQPDTTDAKAKETASPAAKTFGWIYYTNHSDDSKLYKILLDGTEKQKVSDEETVSKSYESGWIYYRNKDNNLCRMSVSGTNIKQIGNDSVGYVSVLNGWIYYSNWSDDRKLYKMRIDGTHKEKLCDVRAYDIVASGDWIYYRNEDNSNNLYKMTITGNKNKPVVDDGVYGITINNGWIYYINESDDHKIYKVTIDGSNKQKICDDSAWFISSFEDWIYYNTNDQIYKMKTDGTNIQKLCSDNARFLFPLISMAE